MSSSRNTRSVTARTASPLLGRIPLAVFVVLVAVLLAFPYVAVHRGSLLPVSPADVTKEGGKALYLRDGRLLEYFEYGHPNGTPILLLHGSLSTGKFWAFLQLSAWTERWRLICPSIPGWGLSDPSDGTAASFVTDVIELLNATSISSRFALAGYSMGATYAAAIVTDQRISSRVHSLGVLMGGPLNAFDLLSFQSGETDDVTLTLSQYLPQIAIGALRFLSAITMQVPFVRELQAHLLVRSSLQSDPKGFLERNVDGFEKYIEPQCSAFAAALERDAVRSLVRTTIGYIQAAEFASHEVDWSMIPRKWGDQSPDNRAVLLLGKRDVLLSTVIAQQLQLISSSSSTTKSSPKKNGQILLTHEGAHLSCPTPMLSALRHLMQREAKL